MKRVVILLTILFFIPLAVHAGIAPVFDPVEKELLEKERFEKEVERSPRTPAKKSEKSIFKKKWFWAVIALAVAGAAAGAGAGGGSSSSDSSSGGSGGSSGGIGVGW